MKRFFIVTNEWKDADRRVTRQVISELEDRGCVCQSTTLGILRKPGMRAVMPTDTDACIVLGGDGTMLEAAHSLPDDRIPLLGVNLGNIGYLTETESQDVSLALERLLRGEYTIEERMMLEGTLPDGTTHTALNDIVIGRYGSVHLIRLQVHVNGIPLFVLSADGIILSTPTGSTGYNISAGGPIVEPTAKLMVMTAIAPHTLSARSIVLSGEDRVEVTLSSQHDGEDDAAEVSFDGAHGVRLKKGETIGIVRAKSRTRIIRLNHVGFLDVLHRKLI